MTLFELIADEAAGMQHEIWLWIGGVFFCMLFVIPAYKQEVKHCSKIPPEERQRCIRNKRVSILVFFPLFLLGMVSVALFCMWSERARAPLTLALVQRHDLQEIRIFPHRQPGQITTDGHMYLALITDPQRVNHAWEILNHCDGGAASRYLDETGGYLLELVFRDPQASLFIEVHTTTSERYNNPVVLEVTHDLSQGRYGYYINSQIKEWIADCLKAERQRRQ